MLALIAVCAVAVLLWLLGGDVNGMGAKVEPMLYVAYIYLGVAVAVMIAMTAMNAGKRKSGNGTLNLIVFGGLAILGVVLWMAVAKSTPVIGADGKVFDDAFTLKISDTGLWLAYITLGLAIVAMLWGTVRKALK
jgi:hypothetical protein